MNDICSTDDVKTFVNAFYEKVRLDDMLAPVFDLRIKPEQWPQHLEKMYSFWNLMLFNDNTYKGMPYDKHADLPVNKLHYERWIMLFHSTIDENFAGTKADEAKARGAMMAHIFSAKATG